MNVIKYPTAVDQSVFSKDASFGEPFMDCLKMYRIAKNA